MKLFQYKAKRDLKVSSEPAAKIRKKRSEELIFVIQEHHARRLHYDLRLELGGVLKSWAVPKQPSLDPSVKRLAVMVEDHPYSYKDFEGTIASGYGAGTVKIWDRGTYSAEGEDAKKTEKLIKAGLKRGVLNFSLKGKRLKGDFHLIRLKSSKKNEWLLIKAKETKIAQKDVSNDLLKRGLFKNLDKVFWPKEKITKGDLMRYYMRVSSWILPHLKDRPQSLKRSPNGIEGETFYQKNLEKHPDWIETVPIKHGQKKVDYLLIQDEKSLLYAVNLGCIELHPFFSRVRKLHNPDFLVFDLDPKGATFAKVIKIAQTIHRILEEIEVPSYCKTSGATGLHIAIALGAKYSYQEAKKFAELIAAIVQQRLPKISTLERSLSKRDGKVYIDCYQNNFGQTLAAPYSVRARPGATVSTPLKWEEVKTGLDPKKYTIKSIFRRLKKMGDLYSPMLEKGVDLRAAIRNLSLLK